MSRFNLVIVLIVMMTRSGSTQVLSRSDSLHMQLRADSARIHQPRILKLFLKVESRYSFVSKERANMYGLMSGITLHDRHTFFLGYFFMDPLANSPITIPGLQANLQHFLDMRYGLVGYQYVIHRSRYWQLNTPITVGYGKYEVEVQDEFDKSLSVQHGYMWPTSAGVQLIYKPWRWVGLSIAGGYRYIAQQENTNLSLKGWYYSFGLWVDGRIIARHLRYHRKKQIYQKNLLEALSN